MAKKLFNEVEHTYWNDMGVKFSEGGSNELEDIKLRHPPVSINFKSNITKAKGILTISSKSLLGN